MNRIRQFFRETLDLSISEARSAIVLFSIIFLALFFTFFMVQFLETRSSDVLIKEFGRIQLPGKKEWKPFDRHYKQSYRSKAARVIRHFPFDPNSSTEADLLTLGIDFPQVRMILNYRNKNGKFRYKEDLKRIYGFKAETYTTLESYIQLPSKSDQNSFENYSSYKKDPAQSTPPFQKKTAREIARFDLNTADTTQLKTLKGIGSVLASRIVKFRDMLGGFIYVEQVGETYGISPEALSEVKKITFINTPHSKIKINSIGPDKLRHPYLKHYQAKAIITYRNQHGKFKDGEDLKNIKNLDEGTITKLLPYLEFD